MMNDILPSYEAANTRDPWTIIAQYIPSRDLCSAALVCRRWHQIFAPQLWGNPASHFGVQNDVVYVALTRFKRTLAWARLSTRQLTHTLHLPPAHAEIYDGPHSDWLRHVLERLPRLQSLIVSELPFFDHGALITLRRPSKVRRASLSDSLPQEIPEFPLFRLRYLEANWCFNATYSGLVEALQHFPSLLYLDLSRTKTAKDAQVLSALKYCYSLRVLKLRSLALTDIEIEALAEAVQRRLKSLDVRDNQLTDNSVRMLLENCFKTKRVPQLDPTDGLFEDAESSIFSPVSRTSTVDAMARLFDEYDKEDLDDRLRSKLLGEFSGTTVINDAYDGGITHLYISNNHLSVEGVSGFLRSKRLHVLDVGTVARGITRPRSSSLLSPTYAPTKDFTMPGAEKLTPIIKRYASEKLTYLRINHAVITEETAAADLTVGRSELQGDLGVYSPEGAQELDALDEVFELSDQNARYEIPGSQTLPVELPGDHQMPVELPGDMPPTPPMEPKVVVEPPKTPEARRGSAFAPEVVPDLDSLRVSDGDESESAAGSDTLLSNGTQRKRASSVAADDRRARLELRQSTENHLHPGMISNIHTLVLTDVPTESTSHEVSQRLIRFIKDCAEETYIAKLQAHGAYALPPGRDRQVAEREYARSLFSLRRIILEMAPDEDALKPKKPTTTWRQYPTKSSTEDADSEAFWTAAERDFSFFGDEECGIPDLEPGRTLPLAMTSEKISMPSIADDAPPVLLSSSPQPDGGAPRYDVVKELSGFRRDRKAVFEARLVLGESEPDVEGFWEGEIKVVRPSLVDETRKGDVDCFGNYYEKGYNYR